MRTVSRRHFQIIVAVALLVVGAVDAAAQRQTRTAHAKTRYFTFYNDFTTNLNDALVAAGVARRGKKPELFLAGDETACFEKLHPSVRTAWDTAVDYYAKVVSPGQFFDRAQFLIRMQLGGFDEELKDASAREFVEIVGGFRTAAAPAYRACRWTTQDARNRRWVEQLQPQLTALERTIATRLEQLYRKSWTLPLHVDIVETVNWAGANSIVLDGNGGHLLVSPAYEGPVALETVFHEASHVLMGPNDPVQRVIDEAARTAGASLQRDAWHAVQFYTTGEVVRSVLDADGKADYTPMWVEIFGRSPWGVYRNSLETAWKPYIEGKHTLEQAAQNLIVEVRKDAQTKADETTRKPPH